ncbi:hypothetical protein MHBO_002438 [Bonamia ostreae]|uniref:Spt5 KOW domain-containing protein n=1 Tax=Bonamia ostreae TaxID=126728 RepID=A0ABV2AMD7_9EUKA
MRRAHVSDAISSVSSLFKRKIGLVPISEMTDTLTTNDKKTETKIYDWVRVKRGLHKGDLALVNDVLEEGLKAEIKLVPRINYSILRRKYAPINQTEQDDSEDIDNDKNVEENKKKKLPIQRKTPPARFFNENEMRRYLGQFADSNDIESLFRQTGGAVIFRGQKFVEGYRHMITSIKNLVIYIFD